MSRYSNNVLSTQWMSTEMVLPSDITSLCHVSCTQWISTEMVSWGTISHCCASPVWRTQWTSSETVLTQRSPATMSHSHYDLSTQWISSKTVLPSEITKHCLTVTMTEAHGEYPAKWCHHQKSFRNHLYMSCKLHVHHECFCLVHTVLHTQWVSIEMVLPWGITIHHQSGPHCFTHTHTECPLKWCCHPQSLITALLCQVHFHTQWMVLKMAWHYQSPSSHHQSSTHNHAGSEHLHSVTWQNRINYHTRLANIPFLCTVNTMLVLSLLVHGKPTHPMVSSRMPCTPLRVCAPSPASQSGLASSSMLSATVLVQCTPTCTPPPANEQVHHPLLYNLGQYHQWCSAQLTVLLVKSTISGKSSAG